MSLNRVMFVHVQLEAVVGEDGPSTGFTVAAAKALGYYHYLTSCLLFARCALMVQDFFKELIVSRLRILNPHPAAAQ